MHRLTRAFGRRTGKDTELTSVRETFVKGCAEFAERIELSDGFRPYLANRIHLDAAVRLAPEVLDPQDSTISVFLGRIGVGLQSAGDLRRSKELHEQALASALQNLGEEHPSVATRRGNLALVLQALGDLEGAKAMAQKAVLAVAGQPDGSYVRVNVERIVAGILGANPA